MKLLFRIILEILILVIISLFLLQFKIPYTDFNFIKFFVSVYIWYFIIRIIGRVVIIFIKYKVTDKYKDYNGSMAKVYLENNIYLSVTIVCFLMIILGVLRIAFTILFIIFLLLYVLSNLSIAVIKNKDLVGEENLDKNQYLKLYSEDNDIPYNLFVGRYGTKLGYEILNIITENTFGILDAYYDNTLIQTLNKICNSNYLFFVQRTLYFGDVDILCGIINSYLNKMAIDIRIDKEEILSKDDQYLKNRRRDNKNTLNNDLKIIDSILKKKHYRIVSIGLISGNENYLCLGVVADKVFNKLKSFEKKTCTKKEK